MLFRSSKKLSFKTAFTLIELLVVIFIIGIIAVFSIISLMNARVNSRDAKRFSDMENIRGALELFFIDAGRYPSVQEFNSGSLSYSIPSLGTTTYIAPIPVAPTPADGGCSTIENNYTYNPTVDQTSYVINFCTAKRNGELPAGRLAVYPSGLSYVGPACTPNCSGKACGDDGCGGSCGTCTAPQSCVAGTCQGGTFMVTIGDSSYLQYPFSIYPAPGGGYFIGGYTSANSNDFYIAKITETGALDASFATGGIFTAGDSYSQQIYQIMPTSDGGVIAVGFTSANNYDMYVVKLTAGGAPDAAFGTNGVVQIGDADQQFAAAVRQLPGGGYIIAGSSLVGGDYNFYAVKLTANGALDTGFGSGGKFTLYESTHQRAYGVEIANDGGYVLTGWSRSSGNYDVYTIKLTSAGVLDTTFGSGGKVVVGNGYDQQVGMNIQKTADGGFIIPGRTSTASNGLDMYAVKLTANGALDTGFGTGGVFTYGDAYDQYCQSIYPLPGGGYIVGGWTSANSNDILAIKLTNSGVLDTSFGTGGVVQVSRTGSQVTQSVTPAPGGGYVIGGHDAAINAGDLLIIKMDAPGNY